MCADTKENHECPLHHMKSDKCLTHLIGTRKRNTDTKQLNKKKAIKKVGIDKDGLMPRQHVKLISHISSHNYAIIRGKALPGKLTAFWPGSSPPLSSPKIHYRIHKSTSDTSSYTSHCTMLFFTVFGC